MASKYPLRGRDSHVDRHSKKTTPQKSTAKGTYDSKHGDGEGAPNIDVRKERMEDVAAISPADETDLGEPPQSRDRAETGTGKKESKLSALARARRAKGPSGNVRTTSSNLSSISLLSRLNLNGPISSSDTFSSSENTADSESESTFAPPKSLPRKMSLLEGKEAPNSQEALENISSRVQLHTASQQPESALSTSPSLFATSIFGPLCVSPFPNSKLSPSTDLQISLGPTGIDGKRVAQAFLQPSPDDIVGQSQSKRGFRREPG